MNLTLDYLKSNRKWLVPNLLVWGNAGAIQPLFFLTEDGASKRVIFADGIIGGGDQAVSYSDLVDNRGNQLPDEIINPVIIIIPRNSTHCYLVGRPSYFGFKIARSDSYTGAYQNGLVDLLIMEVDLP